MNKKLKIRRKGEGGITLIALVITVIVLLILAGVSISMLAGDNSILKNATEAKSKTEYAKAQEEVALAYAEAVGKYYTSNAGTVNLADEVVTSLRNAGYTVNSVTSGAVTGISVSSSGVTLEEGGQTEEIIVTLESANGTSNYVLVDGLYYLLTITESTAVLSTSGVSNPSSGSEPSPSDVTVTSGDSDIASVTKLDNWNFTITSGTATASSNDVTITVAYPEVTSATINVTVSKVQTGVGADAVADAPSTYYGATVNYPVAIKTSMGDSQTTAVD